jgi:hypothetical protein
LSAADILTALDYAADTIAHETVVALGSIAQPMRFLADECCDFAAVRSLRAFVVLRPGMALPARDPDACAK